jgi:hypothetical protein
MKSLRATLDSLSLKELNNLLRWFYAASVHRDILAGINTSLVLFDQMLINTANGQYRQLTVAQDNSTYGQQVAASAKLLLEGRESGAAILLLLPPADFVATRFAMGVSGEKLLRSALKLQVHSLIPACEEELLLGINGGSSEGVALWYPARAAEALYVAFREQGMLLAALMPRTLAMLQIDTTSADHLLLDADAQHITQLECRGGTIKSLLNIKQIDLQQEAFASQWHNECAKVPPAPLISSSEQNFWIGLRQTFQGLESYCFFPAGAEQTGRKKIATTQKKMGGVASIVAMFLLFVPFLSNWVQIALLEAQVEDLREASAVARQSQAAVYEMEEQWGVIAEFPRQDVGQTLLSLNELIDASLSTFAIDKGMVDITGFAQDPAVLIEQLAEREEFFDVGQSRSSSSGDESSARGDRFGIRFSLSDIDFQAYEAKHPVIEQ